MTPNGIASDDASLIAQHVVQLVTLNAVQQRAADVSGFHSVSSFDAGLGGPMDSRYHKPDQPDRQMDIHTGLDNT